VGAGGLCGGGGGGERGARGEGEKAHCLVGGGNHKEAWSLSSKGHVPKEELTFLGKSGRERRKRVSLYRRVRE